MYKRIGTVVLGSSLLFCGAVLAQVSTSEQGQTPTKTQERIQALQEKKEALKLKNCERVQSKLENKVKIYEQNKKKHIASFTKSYQRMVALAEKFEAEGYETTTLREHLATLDTMIKKFEADYALYIQTAQNSGEFSCASTESTFKVKLSQSREQLGSLKNQAVAIRTYWAQTVRADVQALKAIVDADNKDIESNPSNNTEGTN
jgi:multidrug efflux pump subunit AcrB